MDYVDPTVHCPRKAVKFNHSLALIPISDSSPTTQRNVSQQRKEWHMNISKRPHFPLIRHFSQLGRQRANSRDAQLPPNRHQEERHSPNYWWVFISVYSVWNRVEPLCRDQESITENTQNASYHWHCLKKSCLFYSSWETYIRLIWVVVCIEGPLHLWWWYLAQSVVLYRTSVILLCI